MRRLFGTLAICGLAVLATLPAAAATLVVVNRSDDTVDLIDLATGRSRATLSTGNAPHEAAVSPDGRTAVIANHGEREEPGSSLTVIDVAEGRVVRTIDVGRLREPHGIVWIDERTVLVTAEGSARLLLVDVPDGEVHSGFETGQRASHMVAVTPNKQRAFVANGTSGSVTVLDLAAGKKLRDVRTGAGAEGIAVTPDGKEVWVANRAADTLSILDSQSLDILAELPAAGFPIRVALTPDGTKALVTCARSGEIALYAVAERKLLRRRTLDLAAAPETGGRLFGATFGASPLPTGIVIAPDGRRAWVAASRADAVVAIDPQTLDVLGSIRAGREPGGLAYSPR
jgi:YVTN family beta-propeller protein